MAPSVKNRSWIRQMHGGQAERPVAEPEPQVEQDRDPAREDGVHGPAAGLGGQLAVEVLQPLGLRPRVRTRVWPRPSSAVVDLVSLWSAFSSVSNDERHRSVIAAVGLALAVADHVEDDRRLVLSLASMRMPVTRARAAT